jgi:TonB family protein
MEVTVHERISEGPQPHFLLEWEHRTGRHWASVGVASAVIHVFLIALAVFVASLPAPPRRTAKVEITNTRRNVTPLVAPPLDLTQRAPNKNALSKEFNISALQPHPAPSSLPNPGAAALPRQVPRNAKLPDPLRSPVPSTKLTEAPTLDAGQLRAAPPAVQPPALGVPTAQIAPPQIATEEKPKLTFERPGTPMGQTGTGRVQAPKATVEDAVRQVARGSRSGGIIVGDLDGGPIGSPNSPNVPLPGKMGSNVELLSDPMGVDFWPYLIKVLSSVRRNWFAVIPESANLGRTGRVVIQFAINRDGSVPKLVIAGPSGADALDRAAVAGISASNPFPPLPNEFKGSQVRLQFVFKYNVK